MHLSEEKIFKVSELTQLVKLTLESQFACIQVLGEASGVVLASSGHLYFTLKDSAGAMKVVMFRGNLHRSLSGACFQFTRRAARCRSLPATCVCRA
jgi:exodeoxyribonuclease VII large subunit